MATIGVLLKEARTKAGLTQEQLASKIEGLSATDVSKAEREQKMLTQAQLKAIAKVTGVTQKSLLEADAVPKTGTTPKSGSSAKSEKAKTSSEKDTTLTTTEKKMLDLYRKADSKTKKAVMEILEQKSDQNMFTSLLTAASGTNGVDSSVIDVVTNLLGNYL